MPAMPGGLRLVALRFFAAGRCAGSDRMTTVGLTDFLAFLGDVLIQGTDAVGTIGAIGTRARVVRVGLDARGGDVLARCGRASLDRFTSFDFTSALSACGE
jgi:hypothetical protein